LHPLLLLLLLLLLPEVMLDIRSNFGGPRGLQSKPRARSVAASELVRERIAAVLFEFDLFERKERERKF
jgi:hypothetical protein